MPQPAGKSPSAKRPVEARRLRVRGVVQGVGFRPFVFRLAARRGLAGWVLNAGEGVEIHVEGAPEALESFARAVAESPPPAAVVSEVEIEPAAVEALEGFRIRSSEREARPTTRISPDLPVCAACAEELFDPSDRRYHYPYINCTDCGPRYSIILGLPYDRPLTTMRDWPSCERCAAEYGDPLDRRFHAQPVACPECGPTYRLVGDGRDIAERGEAVVEAARLLAQGRILAVKGIGGYHLACDADNPEAVSELRRRKFRKEKPFALMARDIDTARSLVELNAPAEELLLSPARPIVLAPARRRLDEVALDNRDLGVMLPYSPLHLLLFEAGAPEAIVLTSANRSNEPIAYRDDDAFERLGGLTDLFLVGERPIARRIDDSVVRDGVLGPVVLRRSRGYAPAAVARLPSARPLLAMGADLKNSVTLVVDGEAFVSQYIGDLGQYEALAACRETVADLLEMYEIDPAELLVVHDLHPQYRATRHALEIGAAKLCAVQHHRAHVASVLAERGELERRVVGISFDGTGYGDDGTIWGGELFVGSVAAGFERRAHLRPAGLAGGDAAARHPVQAAVGFLDQLDDLPDLSAPPFELPQRYGEARRLLSGAVRGFETTSIGRLFDSVAALLGFTREISFEGQAAIWLEHLARGADEAALDPLPMPFAAGELDFRPTLVAVIDARLGGREPAAIARAFHAGLAAATARVAIALCREDELDRVVLSGGVFQNQLLSAELAARLRNAGLEPWTNQQVPPNDGGVSLGQAALAVYDESESVGSVEGGKARRG